MAGVEYKGKVSAVDELIGLHIKRRRYLLGLSQSELGNALDVSIQQIQKYEIATNRISASKLYILAQIMQVPISYFFNIEEVSAKTCMQESTSISSAENTTTQNMQEKFDFREIAKLTKGYNNIKDPKLRRSIMDMVSMLGKVAIS